MMTTELKTLFERTNEILNEKKIFEAETFKEQLILTYQKQLLGKIAKILEGTQKNTEKHDALRSLLQENWSLVKSTSLCYTVHPEDTLTLLLCDIAEYLGQAQNKPALDLLMPGISAESMHDDYPNLTGENAPDVRQILKTHILSESGDYLIPVRLLNDLTAPWDPSKKLNNYYFDYKLHSEADGFVKTGEMNRLLTHSADARAIAEALTEYEVLLNDNGLLGRLYKLSRSLRFNSTNGFGSETHAGEMAYTAILRFNEYYKDLNDEIKSKIPKAVKTELDLLLSLSSDSTKNKNATENLETCLATRNYNLSNAVKQHEGLLSAIGIDGDKKRELLTKAKEQLESHQQTLVKSIKQGFYTGNDTLGITSALLENLDLKPMVTSLADLNDFMTLSAEEIKTIAEKDEALQDSIVGQFSTLESWVIFSIEAPIDQLKALLSIIGNKLMPKLIKSLSDFSACLMALEGERFEVTLKAFGKQIITSGTDFRYALEYLTPEQRGVIVEAMKDTLTQIIKSGNDFGLTLARLTPEQCGVVVKAMKDTLPQIIKSGADFGNALTYLTPEQCAIVVEAMKDILPQIITNGADFRYALMLLTPEQCAIVVEAMKDILPQIITNGADFRYALMFLTLERGNFMFEAMTDTLPQIIKSGADFGNALTYLTPEQRGVVAETMKDTLPQIIKSGTDFRKVIMYLTPEQRGVVVEAIKDTLPQIIKSGADFGNALTYLTPEKCAVVVEAMKDTLPQIIKSGADFGNALTYLTPEQRGVVVEGMKDTLPQIIKSGTDFGNALTYLTPEERTAMLEAMKDTLPQIIKISTDFCNALTFLTPEQRTVMLEAMKDTLAQIIKSDYEFRFLLEFLTPEQGAVVYNVMQDKLPKVNVLHLIIKRFAVQELQLFLKASPALFDNPSCLGNTLRQIDINLCDKLLDAIKDDLPSIINNDEDYSRVLWPLGLPVCHFWSSKSEAVSRKIQQLMPRKDLKYLWSLKDLAYSWVPFNLNRTNKNDSKMEMSDLTEGDDLKNYHGSSSNSMLTLYRKRKHSDEESASDPHSMHGNENFQSCKKPKYSPSA